MHVMGLSPLLFFVYCEASQVSFTIDHCTNNLLLKMDSFTTQIYGVARPGHLRIHDGENQKKKS